ncbi:MAG: dipicolinate synthase [Acetatifactor sp.]|nr:dipicolinate synthase [Acetatifactor sp.]
MDYRDVCLIGGDRRISYMAPILSREGCRVLRFDAPTPGVKFQEALGGAGTIICGIPFEKNGKIFCEKETSVSVAEFQRLLRKRQMLFGGLFPNHFLRHCEERSIECHDFMKDEALTLFNAVATAEGAILEALSNRETLLHQSNCLVLGFGRCGSLIAQRLWGLHASVTVEVRDPAELAMAMARGHQTLPLPELPESIARFDYVFNTIPACYLGDKCLPQVRQDCLIIDVASGRTGVDYELAGNLSLHALFCPGLPGKYAAKSCAERLVKYVLQIIGSKSS